MEYALWVGKEQGRNARIIFSLNPYSNGICSLRWWGYRPLWLQEDYVLILILMEYALWDIKEVIAAAKAAGSLNPYSNGICSLRLKFIKHLLSAY